MDIYVLNSSLERVAVIDAYKSLIWSDRYYEYGDFEIYTPATTGIIEIVRIGNYLQIDSSEHLMIVESVSIESNTESGDNVIITGRSLESILDRRVVYKSEQFSEFNFQNGIKKILSDAFINPIWYDGKYDNEKAQSRIIPNFVFEETDDETIAALTLDLELEFGDNVYDVITTVCKSNNVGFKILLDDCNFVFSLYSGDDHSYDQEKLPYVIFSPSFENIQSSNYLESNQAYKNVVLATINQVGDFKEAKKEYVASDVSGLDRRELFAGGISLTNGSNTSLSSTKYDAIVKTKMKEALLDNKVVQTFEGEADTVLMFVYGVDFKMGDIVQVSNAYGAEAKSRITEFVQSHDESGTKAYPSFTIVDDDDEGGDVQ